LEHKIQTTMIQWKAKSWTR